MKDMHYGVNVSFAEVPRAKPSHGEHAHGQTSLDLRRFSAKKKL